MKVEIKHRIIGVLILLAVTALFLPLIFYHSAPDEPKKLSAYIPKPPENQNLVYDLPLQGQELPDDSSSSESGDRYELVGGTSEEDLRLRAAKTNVISAKILRTQALSPRASLKKSDQEVVAVKENKDQSQLTSSLLAEPEAWVLQLAAFDDLEHANNLVAQLREMGINVFVKSAAEAGANTVTRVYVGPYINLAKAQKLQQQLVEQLNLKGVIKKYTL